jgi:glycosyltransferase involved in cell wall biosynthesis
VFVTQRVDEADPALGATVAKLRALAARVDELVVLALSATPTDLPANVRVKTFGSRTQVGRALRYVAVLAPELRRRPVAVLAHMAPIYAVLAAPFTRPLRVPLLLWFTHWRASRMLQLAERLATRVLTVDRRSFPLASAKVTPIGHGVEVPELPVRRLDVDGVLRLLALGRTSAAKGLDAIIDGVVLVDDLAVELEIRGPALTEEERRHRAHLVERGARVEDPIPRPEVPALLAQVDALVNNMRAGALDKVVFEAAGAGLPVLVASEGFAELVDGIEPPLRFTQDDARSIAECIRGLAAAGPDVRRSIGEELRLRVQRDHSVERWADEVVTALR